MREKTHITVVMIKKIRDFKCTLYAFNLSLHHNLMLFLFKIYNYNKISIDRIILIN